MPPFRQTQDFADQVYLLPVNAQYVESIIEKERPDGIMLAYGGQTALNCGVNLDEAEILKKYGVNVLGTQINGIKRTEDRQLFKDFYEGVRRACLEKQDCE